MIWLLSKLFAWMNRPYDIKPKLEALRRRQDAQKREKSE